MQSGAENEMSSEYPNRQRSIFTLMAPVTNLVCLGDMFVGRERDLPWIRNATFVIHKPIAILTTALFLFQMATLVPDMSFSFIEDGHSPDM
jgi:hypothetical protein